MSVFTYSLIDAAGVRGTVPVFVDHATSLTAANLAAQAIIIGGLIDAITGAQITDVTMSLYVTPDAGWKAAPVADLDMEQTLLLGFKIGTGVYSDAIDIPCLRDTLIVDGRPDLTASGPIDDFQAAVVSGTGLTGVTIKTKLMDTLTAFLTAAVTFRSRRKNRKAVSKVIVAG